MYPHKGQNQDYTDYTIYAILGIPRIESEMFFYVFFWHLLCVHMSNDVVVMLVRTIGSPHGPLSANRNHFWQKGVHLNINNSIIIYLLMIYTEL